MDPRHLVRGRNRAFNGEENRIEIHRIYSNLPDPVICIDRAIVKMSARLSSSLSAEMIEPDGLGSEKYRDSCGCTSADPRPEIKRNAVVSTHRCSCVWFVCGTDASECKWDSSCTRYDGWIWCMRYESISSNVCKILHDCDLKTVGKSCPGHQRKWMQWMEEKILANPLPIPRNPLMPSDSISV